MQAICYFRSWAYTLQSIAIYVSQVCFFCIIIFSLYIYSNSSWNKEGKPLIILKNQTIKYV